MRVYHKAQVIIERHNYETYTLYRLEDALNGTYYNLNSYLEDWEELV